MKLEALPLPFPRKMPVDVSTRFSLDGGRNNDAHWSLRNTRVTNGRGEVFTVYTTHLGVPEGFETMAYDEKTKDWLEELTERTAWLEKDQMHSPEAGLRHHALVIAKLLARPEPVDEAGVDTVHDWLLETRSPLSWFDLVPYIRQIYAHHSTGCCWHIVLDDGNIDQTSIDFCVQNAKQRNCAVCIEASEPFKEASLTQLSKARKQLSKTRKNR